MAVRERTKILTKSSEAIETPPELLTQRKRPELGRFLLQVDRQTKGSYADAKVAEAAGMAIKTGHPIVQVAIYDAVECVSTILELPAK